MVVVRVEHYATDLPRTQLLRLGRETQKGVGLPFREQLQGVTDRTDHPIDVLVGVEPDLRHHHRQVEVRLEPKPSGIPTLLLFMSMTLRMGRWRTARSTLDAPRPTP